MKKQKTKRRSDHSSAAEEVAGSEDLIREIFLYLPVRSLFRFKPVSKQWLSLISDPQFAVDHVRRTNPSTKIPSGLYFYNSPPKSKKTLSVSLHNAENQSSRVRVPSLSFLKSATKRAKVKITQSCNGLLLCSLTYKSSDSERKIKYCVCNPSTKDYTILPKLSLLPPLKIILYILAFDPSESPHYRVICVSWRQWETHSDLPVRIDIYSSVTRTWRACINQFDTFFGRKLSCGFYWNGVIYLCGISTQWYEIAEFNLAEENLRVIPMPPLPRENTTIFQKVRYFGECNGHLHLIYTGSPCAKLFRVLERDRETLNWFVKYRVHMNRLISTFPEIVKESGGFAKIYGKDEYMFSILSIFKGEKEEDSALILAIPGKVISYNFHHKTTKLLKEVPSQKVDNESHPYYMESFYNVNGFHYIETLSSV